VSRRDNHRSAATDNPHPDCRAPLIQIVAPQPRIALASCVRLPINRSLTPTNINAACCSDVLTGSNRIVGRLIASHSASGSASSFLPLFQVWLGQLGCDQLHLVTEPAQHARPVVGSAAGPCGNHRRPKPPKERHHLHAPKLLGRNRLLGTSMPSVAVHTNGTIPVGFRLSAPDRRRVAVGLTAPPGSPRHRTHSPPSAGRRLDQGDSDAIPFSV
jgi:hypothetical protein